MQCQWTIIKCWSNTQLSPLLYSLKKCLFWTITQKIPSGLKWNLQDKFVLISRSALCKNHAFFSCRVEAACFFFSPISWNFNFCLPICLALKWFKMHFDAAMFHSLWIYVLYKYMYCLFVDRRHFFEQPLSSAIALLLNNTAIIIQLACK